MEAAIIVDRIILKTPPPRQHILTSTPSPLRSDLNCITNTYSTSGVYTVWERLGTQFQTFFRMGTVPTLLHSSGVNKLAALTTGGMEAIGPKYKNCPLGGP